MKPFFSQRRSLIKAFGLASAGFASHSSLAQFRIEVSGFGASAMPIAIPNFKGEELSPQKISTILQNDLMRTGAFVLIDGLNGLDETAFSNGARWRTAGAEVVIVGSIQLMTNGRYEVRCRLWNAQNGIELGAQGGQVSEIELRRFAHRLADWIHEKLLGFKGIADTRIAYISRALKKTPAEFKLWVADSDGENAKSALTSGEPIISPKWSPNGEYLAYVSFESQKPVVYTHHLATGQRIALANFKGSNSSPAWSPDGRELIVTLSRDGGSQIFSIPARGGEPRRISSSLSIDTEAVFSPDGNSIYFVSDRGGAPQIYQLTRSTGVERRITFSSNYNISPAVSPDGKQLAFITRAGSAFKLVLHDLASGTTQELTETEYDERPSFSPNGKQIIYATQISSGGRRHEALMTTTLDGRRKSKLVIGDSLDIREPSWGPYHV